MIITKDYDKLYTECKLVGSHAAELLAIISCYNKNLSRYQSVATATGFDPRLICAIHVRESSQDFMTYLQNGDPLFDDDGTPLQTTDVPEGVGPFPTWEAAAIDALGGPGLKKNWTIGEMLHWAEKYNGLGYLHRGVPSPYLWSFTDQYQSGKYVADGEYDPEAVDKQPGVAAIFKAMNMT